MTEKQCEFFPDARNCSSQGNFTQISNDLIRNPNLSYKARGILILLLSNRDGWKSFIDSLSGKFSSSDGRASVESGLKELETHGFLDKKVFKDKKTQRVIGNFLAYTDTPHQFDFKFHEEYAEERGWVIADHPQKKKQYPSPEKPYIENLSMENPCMGNQHLRILKEKNINLDEDQSLISFSKEKEISFSDENESVSQIQSACSTQPTPRLKRKIEVLKNENDKEPQPKPTPKTPQEIEQIILFWANLGLVKHKNQNTKTYQETVSMLKKLLKGTFFDKNDKMYSQYHGKKFTIQEINLAINRFALAATNFNYEPTGTYKEYLRKLNLKNFLYNHYTAKDKSLFIKYLESEPQLLQENSRLAKDVDEVQTKILKELFVKAVYNGVEPNSWSQIDENHFRRASREMGIWFQNNGKKISGYWNLNGDTPFHKRKRAELAINACLFDLKGDTGKFTPGYLSSATMWNDRMARYLTAQGVLG